ncbi:hypothetical protein [Paenibacillus methanolicus]|uniref:DUF4129 domain-containing protein n=1 Tax=Paenibacillus methanolicus TaxID=582686 RepID=A0A5S5C1L7_9BACL|nr:hypothetical protein [Paenibacillus methanolicus]TYP72498.1 hypothetical protein BCM02_108153 [Paenibacillus methanolicus]
MKRIREASLVFFQGLIEFIVYLPLIFAANGLVQPAAWEQWWWFVLLLSYPAGYLLGVRAAFRQPSVTLLLAVLCGTGIGALLLSVASIGTAIATALGCMVGLYRGARAALAPWPVRFTSAHFSIGLLIYVIFSVIMQRNERFAVSSFLLTAGGLSTMLAMLLVVNLRTVRAESAASGSVARTDAAVRNRNIRLTLLVVLATLLLAASGTLRQWFRTVWGQASEWISRLLAPGEPSPAAPPQSEPAAPPPSMLPAGEPPDPSPWWDWIMYGFMGVVGLFILIAVIRRLPLVPSLLRALIARLALWLRRERIADRADYQDEVDRIAEPKRKRRSLFRLGSRPEAKSVADDPSARLVFLYRTWLSERTKSGQPFEPSRTPIEMGQAEAIRSGEETGGDFGVRLTRAYSAYRYGGIEAQDGELARMTGEIRPKKPKK